ncbi:MAG: hypothetical protein GX666_00155 [Tissierellia bacterium]|nr:hypothetical protein [Tissierellia bacterium]
MAFENYNHYFDIDPEYFPQINKAIINKEPEIWKKFYPHETFVQLLSDSVNVLSRKQRVSIWVEGAYGTGKSHAVLTLKKLLDANEKDTKEYFEKFDEQLGKDLFNKFQRVKTEGKEILTVHRYGSSFIRDDNDLVFAVQESIIEAMREKGIEYHGEKALKDSTIKWLSDDIWKNTFNELINSKYSEMFSGDDVDSIIEKLNIYEDDALATLMQKIMKVGKDNGITVLSMSTTDLCNWITDIIKENNLKGIVFIWDEFTEYFKTNMRSLTGFQELADLSGSDPFYFILVTHDVSHMFPETDKTWRHLQGRFIVPKCNIELPENMAFHLMGAAMSKTDDSVLLDEWNDTVEELYDRTQESRELIKKKARITDDELKNILPIHPYTALLLKHISSAFASNQRSMFDFIKNDSGEKIKGFQWFIKNCSPYDDNPFLTVDMLWDFFYGKGKEDLSPEIRSILDCYGRSSTQQLDRDEKRVLKAVLLLQAISQQVGDTVELFIANEQNIDNIFEGSDLDVGAPSSIANKLVTDKIIYKQPLGAGKYQYCAYKNVVDTAAIDSIKESVRTENTSKLIKDGELSTLLNLTGALRLRYDIEYVAENDFKSTINKIRGQKKDDDNKLSAVVSFAKNDAESRLISEKISEALKDNSYDIIFIDTSTNPMGLDLYEQYVEAIANARYQRNKDPKQADQHLENAQEVLEKWKNNLGNGEFIVYTKEKQNGERVMGLEQLYNLLKEINKKNYRQSLETGLPVTDTMWMANSLPRGVEYGIEQKTSAQYNKRLIEFIGKDAWGIEKYWEKSPYLLISKIKIKVEEIISESFKKDGRVSISEIYNELKRTPFGFMPCNLTAFTLGFVLKEYADETYTWSDGLRNDVLTVDKIKDMVSDVIRLQNTPSMRYNEKYIVTMTKEEKAFNQAASKVFKIPETSCTSIEATRERIRQKMKELSFPLWCLKYVVEEQVPENERIELNKLIDYFVGIANNENYEDDLTDSDIALAIGKLCLKNKNLDFKLSKFVNVENCQKGMEIYLKTFESGLLIELANDIQDNGQYINEVRKRFDADAATWVWNMETAKQKISEVILEYKIVSESNKIINKNKTFDETVSEWCQISDNIKISYKYAQNNWGDLADFMEMLYKVKRSATILDSQKDNFLNLIRADGAKFQVFYNNQVEMFKKVCSFFLDNKDYNFTDMDIKEIFSTIPRGQFDIQNKSDYQSTVQGHIDRYLAESRNKQLKDMWYEKTNTTSPKEWSEKYKMPILYMVPDKEFNFAKENFATINERHPNSQAIEKAIDYLSKTDYFDRLSSREERDNIFKNKFIKDYAVILTDIEKVKDYLTNAMGNISPNDWYGNPSVDSKLRAMAEAEYNETGSDKALDKIEAMDEKNVKHYLKRLIKDNMVVGIEIIKDN